ncbi:hypothetical protein BEL01nite_72190 [Bradyrhizobium elkanii]|nr:hypothetical protein BEL01nite_72190 [Bradyrhizobium elkanii]
MRHPTMGAQHVPRFAGWGSLIGDAGTRGWRCPATTLKANWVHCHTWFVKGCFPKIGD